MIDLYGHLGQPPGTFCFAPLVWNVVQNKCTTVEQAIADASAKGIPIDPKIVEILKTQPAPAPASSSSSGGGAGLVIAGLIGLSLLWWVAS